MLKCICQSVRQFKFLHDSQPVIMNKGFLSFLFQPTKDSSDREIYRLIEPRNNITTQSLL